MLRVNEAKTDTVILARDITSNDPCLQLYAKYFQSYSRMFDTCAENVNTVHFLVLHIFFKSPRDDRKMNLASKNSHRSLHRFYTFFILITYATTVVYSRMIILYRNN